MLKTVAAIIHEYEFPILPYRDDWRTDNIEELRKEISAINGKIVVEVGCWTGHTTVELAKMIPEGGMVYAVDHWEGQHWNNKKEQAEYDPLVETLYQQFLSNVMHEGVEDRICPINLPSVQAARAFPFPADLVFVDACHEEEDVYEDCHAWYPKLAPNGILCGDDWFIDGVQKAVSRFAAEQKREVDIGPLKDHHPIMAPRYSPAVTFWKLR